MISDDHEIVRRDQIDDAKQDEWHERQENAGKPAFGRQGLYLCANLGAVPDELREPRQYFGKIAACLALHVDGHDHEKKVILAHAPIEIFNGAPDIETESNLVGTHAEFSADRIGHFLGHQVQRRGKRMPDLDTAYDHVEGIGQLVGKSGDTTVALAPEPQHHSDYSQQDSE